MNFNINNSLMYIHELVIFKLYECDIDLQISVKNTLLILRNYADLKNVFLQLHSSPQIVGISLSI